MFLSDQLYNRLKFLSQIFLPAVGTLYFALAGIWDLPSANQVVGTVVAVDTFLGVLLGISTASYNKSDKRFDGKIQIKGDVDDEGSRGYTLHLPNDAQQIESSKELRIKVEQPPSRVAD